MKNPLAISLFVVLITGFSLGCNDSVDTPDDASPNPIAGDRGANDSTPMSDAETSNEEGGDSDTLPVDSGIGVPSDAVEPGDTEPNPGDTSPDVEEIETEDAQGPDVADLPPCEQPIAETTTEIPLGETLFVNKDDYLSFWGVDHPCPIELIEKPEGAEASIVDEERWTPDVTGDWIFQRGEHRVRVKVRDDLLNSDTFLNYNYTPANPLLLADETTLYVAAATSNGVAKLLLAEGEVTQETFIPTGSWPTGLALTQDGTMLLVTQTGRDSLGFIDRETDRLVDAIHVGDEPTGILVEGNIAWVTLSGSNQVAQIDIENRTILTLIDVGREPRAMALDPTRKRLYVASLISSNEHPRGPLQGDYIPPESTERDIAVIDTETAETIAFIPHVGTIIRGLWISENGNSLIAGVSHSRNQLLSVDANSRPHEHGLAFVDVSEGSSYSITLLDLDEQATSTGPAPSPFTLRMSPAGDALLITLSAGGEVLALDPETHEELGRVSVGNDPRGLVFAQGRAWTYSWLDNQVVGMGLPLIDPIQGDMVVAGIGMDPTPENVRDGQRIFNDGQFSKYGAFSCNNCHIDGLTDGLVWDILVDGPVNTPAFRNIGGTGPFLWGGFLPTLFDFSREVLKLVGADATGQEMELLTLYMQSVTAPPNPYANPGGKLSDLALEGKEVFDGEAQCISCHSGPLFTNQTQVPGKTEGMITDVPALIGVYDTAPFGREGQWPTLESMVEYAVEFMEAEITPAELEALNQYVREVPGESLYLNSATPLNGDMHVWFESQVELVFSQVLSPGQEALFTFETTGSEEGLADPVSVPGEWVISGRVARFFPEDPYPLKTHYQASVSPGLSSVLGQTFKESLTVSFRTGGVPELDVSGTWDGHLEIEEPLVAEVDGEFAFLQSSGGKVSGVILVDIDEITLSHFEGVVSGTTLVLDSFLLDTVIGLVLVESGEVELIDNDDDGYADYGEGILFALGYPINVTFYRLSLPDGSALPTE